MAEAWIGAVEVSIVVEDVEALIEAVDVADLTVAEETLTTEVVVVVLTVVGAEVDTKVTSPEVMVTTKATLAKTTISPSQVMAIIKVQRVMASNRGTKIINKAMRRWGTIKQLPQRMPVTKVMGMKAPQLHHPLQHQSGQNGN